MTPVSVECSSFESAVTVARTFAAAGPRVAAIVTKDATTYRAISGYMDADQADLEQVALVTPDGRVWQPVDTEE